jgi:uncharacterized membrane protein
MNRVRNVARFGLAAGLIFAGFGHETFARVTFQAQVPPWLPLDADFVVVASGLVEIALGLLLLTLKKWRTAVGWLTALFFLAVFPGNIAQYSEHRNAFGLNSDLARLIRLIFQPLLILWAIWATGAYREFKKTRQTKRNKGEIK